VHHNPRQRWYYLSDQSPSELILIHQGGSDMDSIPGTDRKLLYSNYILIITGVPHSSFVNPLASEGDSLRESIEIRAIVYFHSNCETTTPQ
jgi:hypothetical protein